MSKVVQRHLPPARLALRAYLIAKMMERLKQDAREGNPRLLSKAV